MGKYKVRLPHCGPENTGLHAFGMQTIDAIRTCITCSNGPISGMQGKNQRVMKRDFKQARPDKWSEKSRSQPDRAEYNNEVYNMY